MNLNNLAMLLNATNRLADAELLSRRGIVILSEFFRCNGHNHPHLRDAFVSYAIILKALGRSDAEVLQALQALQAEYGVTLD
jgi:hypothetical protein